MQLTGAPVMQLEIRNAVERDRLIYNGLGFVLGAAMAYLFFRRLSLTLIAVAGPTIAILWTLGMVSGLDFRLNLFINVLTPLILVSGFSDSMHLVFAIRRDIVAGVDRLTAARNAVAEVAPACLLTAMNQAISIVSFAFAEIGADPHLRLCGADRGRDVLSRRRRRRADAGGAADPARSRRQQVLASRNKTTAPASPS